MSGEHKTEKRLGAAPAMGLACLSHITQRWFQVEGRVHKGGSSRDLGRGEARSRICRHVTGPTVLKCPCCLCGMHWAWYCFIGGLPGDAQPQGVCMTSANTPTLGGPVLGLLGCLNLGPSSDFSGGSAGSPGDLSLRPFSANVLGLSFSPIFRD